MEHKQFTSDELNHSPHPNQGFQADRFLKKTSQLNIPDTILENCSGELSGESLKMEALKVMTDCFNSEDKENICNNKQFMCNESLNDSMNITIDNSYIRQCERKLLESSCSDDEKNIEFENKNIVNNRLLNISRKLNETISTPPSLLRKEISLLRTEMAEAHEFHDMEIQLLKDEKCHSEIDSEKFGELLKKYSELMDLYTSLKTEYDEYRKIQEKVGHELQSKTADCLESLCSQIEASDNSLNFSTASFVSFSGGIRSSTMMEDNTEVEATVVHEATVLANDPLSLTNDTSFKTPTQTPLKSAKELFPPNLTSSLRKPVVKEVKDIIGKFDNTQPLDSDYDIQLLNLETAFYDKVKEVKDLEQRLFKIEDLSLVLQSEFERISSVYSKENTALKESLAMKTEQLNELTDKLFTETTSLNPSLRDSLLDVSGKKLLLVFIETIMENCKKIKEENATTRIENLESQLESQEMKLAELEELKKTCENLEKKLSNAESVISTRDEEIRLLQSHVSNVRQTREDLAAANLALSELESRLTLEEAEKKGAENRCLELGKLVESLSRELESNEKIRRELEAELKSFEGEKAEIQKENALLKESCDDLKTQISEAEKTIESAKSEIIAIKESQAMANEALHQLKTQLKLKEEEKAELENRFVELQEIYKNLLSEMAELKNVEDNPAFEKIKMENGDLKQQIVESEKIIADLKIEMETTKENANSTSRKVEELLEEMERLNAEKTEFSKILEHVEERQKRLADSLADLGTDFDSPSERITKLIANTSTSQETGETRETKIISVFVETITKTCKGVQNELTKRFDGKKVEWETQREIDLNLIENLQQQVKTLTEKRDGDAVKISEMSLEKEDLMAVHEKLKNQMREAEKMITTREDEIKELRRQEAGLKQAKDELAAADEAIAELKSRLSGTEAEKAEVEHRCRLLEESKTKLQVEINAREMGVKEMDELKMAKEKIEKEKEDLKEQMKNSEEIIQGLKKSLETAENEQIAKESRIKELLDEIDSLKKGREDLSEKLQQLEENKKNLMEVVKEVLSQLHMPEDTLRKILSGDLENIKVFSEEINQQVKSQVENLREKEVSAFDVELGELKNLCKCLEEKLSEAEKTILAREEEIHALQDTIKENEKDFESRLLSAEASKAEAEGRCRELEEITETLKREIGESEKAQAELLSQLSFAKEKMSEVENESVRLSGVCDVLKVRVLEIEDAMARRDEEIEELKLNAAKQEEKLVELMTLKKAKTISDREEEIGNLKTDIPVTGEVLDDVKSWIIDLENRLAAAEVQKTDAENRSNELEQIVGNLQEEIAAKCSLLGELENQISKLETENEALKQSLDSLKGQMTETISARDEEIRQLKSHEIQLNSVKESLALADDTISKLKFELKSAEDKKSEMESRCSELQESNQHLRVEITTAKNLENNPAYDKIQTENGDLKERILESEKMMAELKGELDRAKEDQMSNICKVEELIREIEDLKKENFGFSCALTTIEETQKNLADVLSSSPNDSDLPSERITKLIGKTSKLGEAAERRETKIVTDLVETITKTCKGVQNELIKKFDSKKLEWEAQKDVDMQNFEEQIKVLQDRNVESEVALKDTKRALTEADETIVKLKSQLSSTEVEKVEVEVRCRKLEEKMLSLQGEIDTKETIIKGLDELKMARQKIEKENEDLKQRIVESEEVIIQLKKSLEVVKEEQIGRESRVKDWQIEIDRLRKEKEGLESLSDKLEKLEKNKKNLTEVVTEVLSQLHMPEDTLDKILSGDMENVKKFSEKINQLVKSQTEELKLENRHLQLGNDNLKEKVKQLTKLIGETGNGEGSEGGSPHLNSMSLRGKPGRRSDLCVRRLDKLEEINHNLTELITRMLTMTEFPDTEKLKLYSVRDFPNVVKKVVAHLNGLDSKMKEMKEENAQLDEECETYAKIIKDLKKEATAVWKANKEKTEAMESEIGKLREEKNLLEKEKEDLLGKMSKLDAECQKLKAARSEGVPHNCTCGNESKKINELKRTILVREQKLLELQDLEAQTSSYKTQIEYLKNALEREKKKMGEEKERNKKLQNELNEAAKKQKTGNGKGEDKEVLEELRMRGSISGGIVQEFVDKEKMRKLAKDIGILKELCRARYAEIKRLEAVNAALRSNTPKNSNQMDSPIRSRGYNTRSKNMVRDLWKTELGGKENSAI